MDGEGQSFVPWQKSVPYKGVQTDCVKVGFVSRKPVAARKEEGRLYKMREWMLRWPNREGESVVFGT